MLKIEGADLESPLPLPKEDYMEDFETDASKCEFEELLGQAREVIELGPAGTREEAYERVGKYVIDQSDVVIALWDGEPSRGQGGTAEIIAYARSPRPGNDERPPGVLEAVAGRRAAGWFESLPALRRGGSSNGESGPRVPLIIVSAVPPHDVTEELGSGVDLAGRGELAMYNGAQIDRGTFDRAAERTGPNCSRPLDEH